MHLVTVVTFVIFYGNVQCEETYSTKWDNTNVEDILRSERLLNSYVKCVMDEGKCSSDGAELKRVLGEALATDCAKCSVKQKEGAEKVISFLIVHKPQIWARLEAKYDPDGTYHAKYAEKYGIADKI